MGLYESIQRSQNNIDELSGDLKDYLQKRKQADATNEFYTKLRQFGSPQTTVIGGDVKPETDVSNLGPGYSTPQPTQSPAQMRAAMAQPKQVTAPENLGSESVPVSASSQIQPTAASQTGEITTRTPSKREALRAYLSNNPPQTPEELNAVKQYADMLDITEPKSNYQMIPKDATLARVDDQGNVTPVATGIHLQGNPTQQEMYLKDAEYKVANDPAYRGRDPYDVMRELEMADKQKAQPETASDAYFLNGRIVPAGTPGATPYKDKGNPGLRWTARLKNGEIVPATLIAKPDTQGQAGSGLDILPAGTVTAHRRYALQQAKRLRPIARGRR